jgi:EAL domain-containing protein (putative c-di-GMP-specific phosphodiesterase class I)
VEDREQAEQLKKAGCDIIQGYYYSHPAPLEEIISELKNNSS